MELDKIRQEIDAVDTKMKALFQKRMELSYQVVESKKQTGGAVYVPEREQAIISARSKDMETEYLLEYQAFLKQLMGISRTYQYTKLVGASEALQKIDFNKEEIMLVFPYRPENNSLSMALNAIALANLTVKSVETVMENGQNTCYLCIGGDFTTEIAKAAILLIIEENK